MTGLEGRHEEDDIPDGPELRSKAEIGEDAEARAAALRYHIDGHSILAQHTPGDAPQGFDLVSMDAGLGTHITEVKGSNAETYRPPRMSNNVDSRQMSDDWVKDRSHINGQLDIPDTNAIGEGPDQIRKSVIQVDYPSGTITEWAVDRDGKVSAHPETIFNLGDIPLRDQSPEDET